ncbi:MAG: glycosyltransferase family 2 protein [Flavisolibacter sp.]
MNCSLIISTYNWPQALSLCLQSVMHQIHKPAEIIIADDGSREDTTTLVQEYIKRSPVAIRHVWHPDEGFRLASIRNKAIADASNDYIVQVDGDLILHPYFIADHLAMKKEGYFVAGSRVMLSKRSTSNLLAHNSINLRKYAQPNLDMNGIRSALLRRYLASRYKAKGKYTFYVKGCNMAFFKADLLKVNGYNESFTGWGSEDREIAIRLINAGVKKHFLKNGGICYHLNHSSPSKEKEFENEKLMKEAIASRAVWADNGLNKYLHS